MTRIPIASIQIVEAPFSLAHTEDGPVSARNGWLLEATTKRGDVYAYAASQFTERDNAAHLASRVHVAGSIDPIHWAYSRAAYGSVAWLADGFEAAEIEHEVEALAWE